MRTIFVLQDLTFGGCQRQALMLANHLDRNRFAPEVWVMTSTEGGFWPMARQLPFPVVPLTREETVGLRSIAALGRKLVTTPAEVIVPFTAVPNIWCRVFAALVSGRFVAGTCRGGDAIRNQHERWLKSLAHRHVCNTRELAERLTSDLGVPASRVEVIANAIKCPEGPPAPLEGGKILCVARYEEIKELHVLIRAFASVVERFPEAQLVLAGEGSLEGELRQLVGELGLSDGVSFHPPQSKVESLYAEAAVFALSSRAEGAPNVLLEAGAAGVPVVATAVGGIPDIVEHGRTGLLVPSGAPGEMAEALCRLLEDRALRREMGEAARARICERHGLRTMVDSYEELFTQLLERG